MRRTFDQIAFWKKVDVVFQCLVFITMLLVISFSRWSLFGLYVMAAGQLLSSIAWTLADNDLPQRLNSNTLRKVIISVCLLLLLFLGFAEGAFFIASIGMLVFGPFLGIWYFIATVQEQIYFSKARKPYYLL
jgi:hypothetical protein